jgi:Reverse transcriptase (RNA-dependent DNA polymerase)
MQGSILGPILFLCFINDLPNCTDLLTLLFADDTAGVTAGPELGPLIAKSNIELQKIATWFRANKMAVNISKTKYIIFKPKNKKVVINPGEGIVYNNNDIGGHQDPNKTYELGRIYNDHPVASERTYKLLGVLLDENLSFDQHCTYVCSKLAQSNYIISKCKNVLPRKALRTLYYSLIHPYLLYCLPLYGCTTRKNINKIAVAQKKSIRSICNVKYNEHTGPLFRELGIMPLDKLLYYTKSLLVHSIYHKYCPKILHNTWVTNADRNIGANLRNENDLYVPLATSDQVKKLPFFDLANLWNQLPYDKMHANPITFKIQIKNHIWENAGEP